MDSIYCECLNKNKIFFQCGKYGTMLCYCQKCINKNKCSSCNTVFSKNVTALTSCDCGRLFCEPCVEDEKLKECLRLEISLSIRGKIIETKFINDEEHECNFNIKKEEKDYARFIISQHGEDIALLFVMSGETKMNLGDMIKDVENKIINIRYV